MALRTLSLIMERNSIQEIKLTPPNERGDTIVGFPEGNKLPRFLYAIWYDMLSLTIKWLTYEEVRKFIPEDIPHNYRWALLKLDIDDKGKPTWLPFLEGRE